MQKSINEIRFYGFISGVLGQQQRDPFCRSCKAFASTIIRMKEGLSELRPLGETMPAEILAILEESRFRLEGIEIPEDAVGQKRAGKCKMPEGVCFIKFPKMIRDKI